MAQIITAGEPEVSTQGEFLAGSSADFFLTFPDAYGEMYDPSTIDLTVTNSTGTVVISADSIQKLDVGYYVFEWDVPTTTTPGTYHLNVSFVAEEEYGPTPLSYSEAFTISETATNMLDSTLLTRRIYLEYLLGYAQRIPVFNEIGRYNIDRTAVEFSFGLWNQPSPPKIYLNKKLTNIAHSVDYLRGRILFDNPLLPTDEITATYNFRWFKDEELNMFLTEGVNIFNQYPPVSAYSLWSIPGYYAITGYQQAAVIALRRLMMDIMWQTPAKVLGGMDRADKIMGSLETLKKNYEDELKLLYEMKARGPYVGLTRTISTPEFALPGGRSRWFRYLLK